MKSIAFLAFRCLQRGLPFTKVAQMISLSMFVIFAMTIRVFGMDVEIVYPGYDPGDQWVLEPCECIDEEIILSAKPMPMVSVTEVPWADESFEQPVYHTLEPMDCPPIQRSELIYDGMNEDAKGFYKINNTTVYPYKTICKLLMRYGSTWYVCSGSFIMKDRLLLTAGHCIYSEVPQGSGNWRWADQVIVIPGLNGNQQPFGQFASVALTVPNGWRTSHDWRYDWGAVALGSSSGVGNMGHAVNNVTWYFGKTVRVTGYPAETGFSGNEMYENQDNIWYADNYKLYYRGTSYGGMSGGPIFYLDGGQYYILGDHAYSGPSGTRLRDDVLSAIDALDRNNPTYTPTPGGRTPTKTPTPTPTFDPNKTYLRWDGGDPDAGDIVYYDVYFEANVNPPTSRVVNDTTNRYWYPGKMNSNTTYYWQVLACDNHGDCTSGDVWRFTTWGAPPPATPTPTMTPTSTPPMGNLPPIVNIAGYMNTRLTNADGGIMTLLAYATDHPGMGMGVVSEVEILYQGVPTGVKLTLVDPANSIWQFQAPISPGAPVGKYNLELLAKDIEGAVSSPWPYLVVPFYANSATDDEQQNIQIIHKPSRISRLIADIKSFFYQKMVALSLPKLTKNNRGAVRLRDVEPTNIITFGEPSYSLAEHIGMIYTPIDVQSAQYGNNPPHKPSNPIPADGATDVNPN